MSQGCPPPELMILSFSFFFLFHLCGAELWFCLLEGIEFYFVFFLFFFLVILFFYPCFLLFFSLHHFH